MRNRLRFGSVRLVVTAVLVMLGATLAREATGSPLSPQQQLTYDFETRNLQGWTRTGTAFDYQPTLDDNPTARDRGEPSNHQGRWWIGTYESYGGRPGERAGGIQGDGPQGTLSSRTFTLPAGSVSFLVGGGSDPSTRVEVETYDQIEGTYVVVYSASGQNSETMRRVCWDVGDLAGRAARILIVDESSGGWGHINADDFNLSPNSCNRLNLTLVNNLPPTGAVAVPPVRSVVVPSLIGRDTGQARSDLAQWRLALGRITPQPARSGLGTVVSQSPQPGDSVVPPHAVDVVVAAPVRVPLLVNRSIEEATDILARMGLRRGDMTERLAQEPAGTVVAQSPEPRTPVPLDAVVDLWISRWAAVPNLVAETRVTAERLLARTGLRLGSVRPEPSVRPFGNVLRQSIPAGSVVPPDSAVDIVVATGMRVPDVVSADTNRARQLLARVGLASRVDTLIPSDRTPGTVLGQDPRTGVLVPLDTVVGLAVAVGVPVPDVRRLDRGAAGDTIRARGLRLGAIGTVASAERSGTVLDQDPAPGVEVPLGITVDLVAAVGVSVPRIVDLPVEGARAALQRSELEFGTSRSDPSPRPMGTVLEQTPAAGSVVPLDTPIDVVLAGAVLVPDVVRLDSAAAVGELEQAGLRLGAVERGASAEALRTVLDQRPVSGTPASLQTPVDIRLSVGVAVPALVGRDSGSVRPALESVGLRPGLATTLRSADAAGTVLVQEPEAGTEVPLDTPVSVTVAIPRVFWKTPFGIGAIATVVAAATLLSFRLRKGTSKPVEPGEPTEPSERPPGRDAPSVVVHPDRGNQRFTGDHDPGIVSEFRFIIHTDAGTQEITGEEPLLHDDHG